MGRLPEQFQANVAQLNTYQMMVSQANESLSRLQQQKLQLETQLQNNNTNLNYYNSILEDQVTVGGTGAGPQREAQPAQPEDHEPAVGDRRADGAVDPQPSHHQAGPGEPGGAGEDSARKPRRKTWKDRLPRRPPARPSSGFPISRHSRRSRISQASNNVLKTEMQNLNLQMDEKVKQIQELNRMIANYQARVEGSPQLEGQYIALTRDLSLAKQSYEDMHRKNEVSETAKDLEEHKAGENLEVLDAASDPQAPSEPNRLQIAAMGTGLGPDARHRAGRRQGDEEHLA